MHWYYAEKGKYVGPVSEQEISELVRTGVIAPSDLVWRHGWPEWRAAGEVEGLFAPPPIPVPSKSQEDIVESEAARQGESPSSDVDRMSVPSQRDENRTTSTTAVPTSETPGTLPTNWLDFYIYVHLYIGGGICLLASLIGFFLWIGYGAQQGQAYLQTELKSSALLALVTMPTGVLAVTLGHGLSKREEWAWNLNWASLVLETLCVSPLQDSPLFLVLTAGKASTRHMDVITYIIGVWVMAIIWLLPNGVYFSKRRSLFS